MTSSPSTEPAPRLGRELGGIAVAAVLYFLGFVGFGQLYLSWLCFVPVLYVLRGASVRRALGLGVLYGGLALTGGYYWIVHLLIEFAHLAKPLAGLGFVLLCVYQGLSLALIVAIVRFVDRRAGLAPVWGLPLALAVVEPNFPFLFPHWHGNSQFRFSQITQIVELFGMSGLGVLLGLVNGALYELVVARVDRRRVVARRIYVPAAAFAFAFAFGVVRLSQLDAELVSAEKVKVGLVQTNLGAGDKHTRVGEFIARHVEMSRQLEAAHPDVDLIVWPESAYNKWIPRSVENLSNSVTVGITKPVLFGALTFERGAAETSVYNSAVLTSSTGAVLGIYDKIVLLAFGETIPLIDTFPLLKKWLPYSSVFARGQTLAPLVLDEPKVKMLTMICYEDIIPRLVLDMWRAHGPPDLLVNVTNDSWYGDTHEPWIHLVLASFRAIETRRALVRSTNTGISALIDPAGRLVARTGQWTRETLVGEVPIFRDGRSTLYMWWGDLLSYLAIAILVGLWLRVRQRSRSAPA